MADTPEVDFDSAIKAAEEVGRKEGYDKGLTEILDYLTYRYIDADVVPDRDSFEGQAMLKLAQECAAHLRELKSKEKASGNGDN